MQRFGSKAGLKRSALMLAWDRLDQRTAALAGRAPRTPRGAIEILVRLSTDYEGIEAYAEGLLLLREDLRDPALRARGAAWIGFPMSPNPSCWLRCCSGVMPSRMSTPVWRSCCRRSSSMESRRARASR